MLLLSSKYIRELNEIIQRHIFLTSIPLLMFIIVQIQFRTRSKQRDSQLAGVLHGLVMAHSELNMGETVSFYLQPRTKVTTAIDAYTLQIPPLISNVGHEMCDFVLFLFLYRLRCKVWKILLFHI